MGNFLKAFLAMALPLAYGCCWFLTTTKPMTEYDLGLTPPFLHFVILVCSGIPALWFAFNALFDFSVLVIPHAVVAAVAWANGRFILNYWRASLMEGAERTPTVVPVVKLIEPISWPNLALLSLGYLAVFWIAHSAKIFSRDAY